MTTKVRVLSIDGGGMRGIIPATVLEYVESKLIEITENPHARIADYFDIIVGTSTGGILTCFYLTPNSEDGKNKPNAKYTASQALEFYSKKGYSIFNASKNKLLKLLWIFGDMINATQYKPKVIEQLFEETFADVTMSHLLKPCLVTTYDIEHKKAVFFSKVNPANKDKDFLIRDVARSTSAAPTYFPPAKITNVDGGNNMVNIDGGVFANNPAMCAYTECRKSEFGNIKYPGIEDIYMLSIGTGGGMFKLPNTAKSKNWGVLSWAKSIPEIMMDGSIDTVHTQMDNLFGSLGGKFRKNYKRIDVPWHKRNYSPDMADASDKNIKDLKEAGKATLEAALTGNNNELGLDAFINGLIA